MKNNQVNFKIGDKIAISFRPNSTPAAIVAKVEAVGSTFIHFEQGLPKYNLKTKSFDKDQFDPRFCLEEPFKDAKDYGWDEAKILAQTPESIRFAEEETERNHLVALVCDAARDYEFETLSLTDLRMLHTILGGEK